MRKTLRVALQDQIDYYVKSTQRIWHLRNENFLKEDTRDAIRFNCRRIREYRLRLKNGK